MTRAESDLAAPVTAFLAAQGWTVRSEVKDCDVAAVRGGDLLVVELKRSLTLALLVQAVRRQRLTDTVYLAVPRPHSVWQWRQANRGVLHLLRRLELGLLFVSLDPDHAPVEVALQPLPLKSRRRAAARRAVLEEIAQRSADYNTAGSSRRKLVTSYREQALRIACLLSVQGDLAPRELRALGTGPRTRHILYQNVYGWFQRVGTGVYRVSARGRRELGDYPELAGRFLAEAKAASPALPARPALPASPARPGGVSSRKAPRRRNRQ